jgi:hypothetical protein
MLLRAAGPAGVSARQVARLVKNLDPDDRTATAAAKDLVYRDTRQDTRHAAEHAPLGADLAQPIEERETGTRELRELDHSSEPLYVVGHGNLVRIGDSLEMHADKAANKSPQDMVDWLVAEGLPASYTGTLVLVACHAGTGRGVDHSEDTYAKAVHEGLRARGYRFLSVKAPRGAVVVGKLEDQTRYEDGHYKVLGTAFAVDDDRTRTDAHKVAYAEVYAAGLREVRPLRAEKAQLLAEETKLKADIAGGKASRWTPAWLTRRRERRLAEVADRLVAITAVGARLGVDLDRAWEQQDARNQFANWKRTLPAGAVQGPEAMVRYEGDDWWEVEVDEYQRLGGLMDQRFGRNRSRASERAGISGSTS